MTETAADEQDLAKALDNVASAASSLGGTSDDTNSDNNVELPPIVPPNSPVAPPATDSSSSIFPPITPAHDSNDMQPSPVSDQPAPEPTPDPLPEPTPAPEPPAPTADQATDNHSSTGSDNVVVTGPLADIKQDALSELRPLVDKLNVSPEEKFDTYLLLIRSTDDTSLIAPAHDAAKSIADEARRAEALLDIIKEIDYLSRQDKSKS